MIHLAEQWCIQVEATNVCTRRCSNCTRSLAHARKPFFITPVQFAEAMDALKDFPEQSDPVADGRRKVLGIIGGEPLLHPQFDDLCEIFQEVVPDRSRRALWTGLPWRQSEHANVIRHTFGYMNLNLHNPPSKHQPILVAIQDVIQNKEEMWRWINDCWVQRIWSSTINPRGFYFCEVAAALADIFDGPDGLPVTPGCWRRDLADFRYQIEWACPRCGCALPLPARTDLEHQDDATQTNIKALKGLHSPGVSRLVPFKREGYDPQQFAPGWSPQYYADPATPRIWQVVTESDPLKMVRALTVSVGYDDILAHTLPQMLATFKDVFVVTSPQDETTARVARSLGAKVYPTDAFYRNGASFNKGLAIEECFTLMEREGWMAVIDADILLPDRFPDFQLQQGVLYSARRRVCEDVRQWQPGADWGKFPQWLEVEYSGYLHIFHAADPMLAVPPWYGTTWRHAGGCDSEFQSRWDARHKQALPWEVLHLGPVDTNWCGRLSTRLDDNAPAVEIPDNIEEVLHTYRTREFSLHRLIDPEVALSDYLDAMKLDDQTRSRALQRLEVCREHGCRYYRGDWCWDTPGGTPSMERFVERLVHGTCDVGNNLMNG